MTERYSPVVGDVVRVVLQGEVWEVLDYGSFYVGDNTYIYFGEDSVVSVEKVGDVTP